MNQMMIRGRLLATVATVVWLACVMGTEAKGANAKPPSGPQDMGSLSASNDYNVLLNLTLKNGSPVVHTVDIADIPTDQRCWNVFVEQRGLPTADCDSS